MSVLVSAASKHGSTAEVAERIGARLRTAGLDVDVLAPAHVLTVRSYDACVLGSAVYAGHWLSAARDLVQRTADELVARPVWLFSSGPLGDPLEPHDHAVDVEHVLRTSAAREHRLFAGSLDRERLGFAERAVVRALHVPSGDFRDWGLIEAWADSIAAAIASVPAVARPVRLVR